MCSLHKHIFKFFRATHKTGTTCRPREGAARNPSASLVAPVVVLHKKCVAESVKVENA